MRKFLERRAQWSAVALPFKTMFCYQGMHAHDHQVVYSDNRLMPDTMQIYDLCQGALSIMPASNFQEVAYSQHDVV